MLGQVLSHYRIIKKLGAGGMGEVYLAEDTTLGRRVALKLLPHEHTQDEERLRRFKQEAKSASGLNHPNILTIHEVGVADGHHFIATEFIDGDTLRALLKRAGTLEIDEALRIAAQVSSALAAAHEAGIVHRDIKPENIMLRADGYVKVLDFGLAKLTETEEPQLGDTIAPTISAAAHTEAGMVLGTPQYMSPEQTKAGKVDARSDIFSFGAVLYEMVSGQRAFQGASRAEIVAAILNQEPKPLPSKVPLDLTKIVLRCLRKDASRRYQTMADLKAALEDLREESASLSRKNYLPQQRRWISRAIWSLALVMIAILGIFAFKARRIPQNTQPLQATALTTLPGVEQSPSLSPDGNYVVFSWTGPKQQNQDIYVQMIGSGSPLPLTTNPRDDYNPVWSPDGRWIAFLRSNPPAPTGLRNRELLVIPPLGGSERKLAEIRSQDFLFSAYLDWSADSKYLVVTDSPGEGKPDALFVVSLETGEKRILTKPQPPVLADTSPAVSPDGRSLIFLRRTTWSAGELHLLPLQTAMNAAGEPKRLTPIELRADFPAWMPEGDQFIFSARRSLWRMPITDKAEPIRIADLGDAMMPAVSGPQSGKPTRLVFVRSLWDGNFWRIETPAPGAPSTSAPVMAISSTKEEYHCNFSPDGRRVTFTSLRSGDAEIWVSDPDGSNALQLTFLHAFDSNCPYWSPDGKQIAFSSSAEGEFDVYVISATGGKPKRLTSHPSIDIAPKFSRDGKWIYFSSMRTGEYRVWKMPATGGDAVQVTPNEGAGGAVESPDGRNIYYHVASVVSPLWRLPTSGGEPVKALDDVLWFNWYLFDKGVYYIDQIGKETRLQYRNFDTGKSTTIAGNLGEVAAGLTATPDGKTILFTRVDSYTDDLMLVENFQ